MLERWRGKRVVIVGDSLNRNMWESLACILYSSMQHKSRAYVNVKSHEYKMFRAMVVDIFLPFKLRLELNYLIFVLPHLARIMIALLSSTGVRSSRS